MARERGDPEFRHLAIAAVFMAVMGVLVVVVAAIDVGTGADIASSGAGVLGLILLLIGALFGLTAYLGNRHTDD